MVWRDEEYENTNIATGFSLNSSLKILLHRKPLLNAIRFAVISEQKLVPYEFTVCTVK